MQTVRSLLSCILPAAKESPGAIAPVSTSHAPADDQASCRGYTKSQTRCDSFNKRHQNAPALARPHAEAWAQIAPSQLPPPAPALRDSLPCGQTCASGPAALGQHQPHSMLIPQNPSHPHQDDTARRTSAGTPLPPCAATLDTAAPKSKATAPAPYSHHGDYPQQASVELQNLSSSLSSHELRTLLQPLVMPLTEELSSWHHLFPEHPRSNTADVCGSSIPQDPPGRGSSIPQDPPYAGIGPTGMQVLQKWVQDLTCLSLLGRGGHGAVYQAEWHGAKIAAKLLVSVTAEELQQSMVEAVTGRMLAHPHIVHTYAAVAMPVECSWLSKHTKGEACVLQDSDDEIEEFLSGYPAKGFSPPCIQAAAAAQGLMPPLIDAVASAKVSSIDPCPSPVSTTVPAAAAFGSVLFAAQPKCRSGVSLGECSADALRRLQCIDPHVATAAMSSAPLPQDDTLGTRQWLQLLSDGQQDRISGPSFATKPFSLLSPEVAMGTVCIGWVEDRSVAHLIPAMTRRATSGQVQATRVGRGSLSCPLSQHAPMARLAPLPARACSLLASAPTIGAAATCRAQLQDHVGVTRQELRFSDGTFRPKAVPAPGGHFLPTLSPNPLPQEMSGRRLDEDHAVVEAQPDGSWTAQRCGSLNTGGAPSWPPRGQAALCNATLSPAYAASDPLDKAAADGEDFTFGAEVVEGPTMSSFDQILGDMNLRLGQHVTVIMMEHCDRGCLISPMENGMFLPSNKWGSRMALQALIRTATEIVQGLAYLHSLGITHGDLKPGNVLLKSSRVDRRGFTCRITDFGMSTMGGIKSGCDQSSNGIGTLLYTSPESLEGPVTPASDVWSFGVMLLEMATGKHPFSDLHWGGLMAGLLDGSLIPEWPDSMEPVLRRLGEACTARDPDKRPKAMVVSKVMKRLDEVMSCSLASSVASPIGGSTVPYGCHPSPPWGPAAGR